MGLFMCLNQPRKIDWRLDMHFSSLLNQEKIGQLMFMVNMFFFEQMASE